MNLYPVRVILICIRGGLSYSMTGKGFGFCSADSSYDLDLHLPGDHESA